MRFSILTLFPDMVMNGLNTSIIGRAVENGVIELQTVNIRDYTNEKHGKVDDYTYGGGAGMLMQAQPVYDAWKSVIDNNRVSESASVLGIKRDLPRTIYVTPQGTPFCQSMAKEFAKEEELIILCGHYEGIDERVLEETVTDYVSIGDYVLTGGELAAMVMVDAIARLVPGVLGNEVSADTESFHRYLLEYPQYSRPEVWHDKLVPEELLSGNHRKISEWRLEQSKFRTRQRRPDLYQKYMETETVMKRLARQKRNYIHMIETLSRGKGEILYAEEDNILIYDRECHLAQLTVGSVEKGMELLELVPKDVQSFELSEEFMVPVLEERGAHVDMKCVNACYTNRELMTQKAGEIRQLGMDSLGYVLEHYEHANEMYITERIRAGAMYGLYVQDNLVGFIGEHEEGSIGLLFVDKQCRRQGYGETLEIYMINKHRNQGYIPYGQVEVDNEISMKLQEKKGLYVASKPVWWMSVGDKWQNKKISLANEREI